MINEEYATQYQKGWKDGFAKGKEVYERQTGEWIVQEPKGVWTHNYKCSSCGGMVLSCELDLPKYCGHCGSDMRMETWRGMNREIKMPKGTIERIFKEAAEDLSDDI